MLKCPRCGSVHGLSIEEEVWLSNDYEGVCICGHRGPVTLNYTTGVYFWAPRRAWEPTIGQQRYRARLAAKMLAAAASV